MATKGNQGLKPSGIALPDLGGALGAAAGGVLAGLCFAVAIQKAGPIGAIAPALAILGLVLLRFPGAVLAIILVGTVLFEPNDPGLVPHTNELYEVIGSIVTPVDLLLFTGLAGLLIRFAVYGRRPIGPAPMTPVLALLGMATIAGLVTGYTAHAGVPGGEFYHRAMNDIYIIALPILCVNTIRDTGALRMFLVGTAALASIKGISGAYAALDGVGLSLENETVSYLDPLPNMVMMAFVFGVAAAAIRKVRMPVWMLAGAPIALVALTLSYRRSFWIATLIGMIAVVILASRYRGRAVLAIGAVVAALVLFALGSAGSAGPSSGPLIERVQTLNPAGEDNNRGDQYRNDERHNVIANIEENPLTGVGLGVQWKVHYPLAESHPRNYVHFALLWFWLELGPLGALAYIALMAGAAWTALRVFREHPDPVVKVGAIAAFATVLGLVFVELTATFTGVEPRFSIMVGALVGWLVAAWRDIPTASSRQGILEAVRL